MAVHRRFMVLSALLTILASGGVAIAQPRPAAPPSFRSIDVTFSGFGGTTLAGTLTVPTGTIVASAVLLPGSGPGDRDATVGPHKPFRVMAEYLAGRGIATLRTDSRGTGKSAGKYFESTGETMAGDAIAGVEFLRARADTRGRPSGVIGHSLGGAVAALAARKSAAVAFAVLLSSPGRPGLDNATERLVGQLEEKKLSRPEIDRLVSALRRITANPDGDNLRADLQTLTKISAGDLVAADQLDALVDQQVVSMRSPWGRYFGSLDPRPVLGGVRCPVLALGGSLDRVLSVRNLEEAHRALGAGQNGDATVLQVMGINHWLQDAQTGEPAEIGSIKQAVSPRVLSLVADWVRSHSAAPTS